MSAAAFHRAAAANFRKALGLFAGLMRAEPHTGLLELVREVSN